jgi:hypothetical protein
LRIVVGLTHEAPIASNARDYAGVKMNGYSGNNLKSRAVPWLGSF